MKYYTVRENPRFAGRQTYWQRLREIDNNDAPVNRKVIKEVQEKLDRFIASNPKYRRYTLETALITTEPVSEKLAAEGFFTYLIVGEELFDE